MLTTKTAINREYIDFINSYQKSKQLTRDLGYSMNSYYIFLCLISLIRRMSSLNINPEYLIKETCNIIALYCNNNNIKMIDCVSGYDYKEYNFYELEYFVDIIRKEVMFEEDMSEHLKIKFMTFLFSTVVPPNFSKEQIINILKQ